MVVYKFTWLPKSLPRVLLMRGKRVTCLNLNLRPEITVYAARGQIGVLVGCNIHQVKVLLDEVAVDDLQMLRELPHCDLQVFISEDRHDETPKAAGECVSLLTGGTTCAGNTSIADASSDDG